MRIALPFQTIETVNESAQDRRRNLELFASGRDTEWRNRLIWGDNKYVLPSLLSEFSGRVSLIYIDPPFSTGQDFSYLASIPDHANIAEGETTNFTKEPSILEQKAYRDTWGKGLDSYLQMMFERLTLMRDLLSDDGSIYIHVDWRLNAPLRMIVEELFSREKFMCQIVWKRSSIRKAASNKWLSVDDTILVATKSPEYTFNTVYVPYSEEYKKRFTEKDERGYYYWIDIGTYSQERLQKLQAEGRVRFPKDPKAHPRFKHYLHEGKGVQPDNVWTDIVPINSQAKEDTGYDTQKPEALLERILKASSNDGDLILDCFAGSGTTAAVAEKLNRRWIVCDLSRFAIHTTRKRLLGISGVKPFIVQNLGKYERQVWQVAEFPANGKDHLEEQREREAAYRKFILDLYHATPMSGYSWLHGTKSGRMVHVAAVDAPVTQADVKAIAREAWKAVGSGKDSPTKAGVDILGWEFALEVNELAKNVAAESRVDVSFKKIPREVLDKKAVEQGDVKFFELGALSVEPKTKARELNIRLTDFVIPTDDIPEEARKAIKHWSQLIDYWAVDWDYKNDTFHNQWQAYRPAKTRKSNSKRNMNTRNRGNIRWSLK